MTTKQRVEYILQSQPETRSSDKKLIMAVWQMQGFYLSYRQQEKFMKVGAPETIRRERQKFQENNQYLANKTVGEARKWKSLVMQQNAPTAKPKTIDNILEPKQQLSLL